MPSSNLAALLKLPADEGAELAMALWESLTDRDRESELELTAQQKGGTRSTMGRRSHQP
jgi:hypothetical protein